MNTIQTFKFGLRYREVKSCFLAAAEQEVAVPGSLLVNGWTVVEDRIVPGIFPPGLLTDTALAERRPGPGLWFSALPRIRRHGQYSRNMLGFTLGLASCEVSSARLQSRLWVVDRRGRVRYCDSQDRVRGGERLEYCWLSHSLPHDIRSGLYYSPVTVTPVSGWTAGWSSP